MVGMASLLVAGLLRVAVIAHRGEHLAHPENTLPAVQSAMDLGCDWVEVDVRTTSDGRHVIIHNDSVDARTNGAGKVRAMTFEQIRALDAGVKFSPRFQGVGVPSFDEVLALARPRIGVYVDAKDISASDLVAALDRHDMRSRVVVYGSVALLQDLTGIAPQVRVMPEAVSVPILNQLLGRLKPRVVAFSAFDFRADIVEVARRAKVDIFVDRLGAEDTAQRWAEAVEWGATGIQTDHPAELIEFLKSRGKR